MSDEIGLVDENETVDYVKESCIEINARFYLRPHHEGGYSVYERYTERKAFDNASEAECREWIERNYTPEEMTTHVSKFSSRLSEIAPKLLALLRQYHEAMPTKESGTLIAEALGWT